MSCAFQPFHTPGPTARMSAVVRIVSSFSRSSDCTTAAKFSMVLRSDRSRDCATLDMIEVLFDQPGDGFGLGRREAEPRQNRRATRAPAIE